MSDENMEAKLPEDVSALSESLEPVRLRRRGQKSMRSTSMLEISEEMAETNESSEELFADAVRNIADLRSASEMRAVGEYRSGEDPKSGEVSDAREVAFDNARANETHGARLPGREETLTPAHEETRSLETRATHVSEAAESRESVANEKSSIAGSSSEDRKSVISAYAEEKRAEIRKNASESARSVVPVPGSQRSGDSLALSSSLAQCDLLARQLDNGLNALRHAQSKAEQRQFFSSATAYVLFCVITALGLYFAMSYKFSATTSKQQLSRESFAKLQESLHIATSELERERRSSEISYEIYQLSEQRRYDEALELFAAKRADLTHPAELALLTERIEGIRVKLAEENFRTALAQYRESNYEQARELFNKCLAYALESPNTHLIHFYLAMSHYNLGDYQGAKTQLENALKFELSSEMDANARWFLAVSTEKVGENAKAYALYESFAKKYRHHRYAEDAQKKMGRLEKFRK